MYYKYNAEKLKKLEYIKSLSKELFDRVRTIMRKKLIRFKVKNENM